jgi:hypothetical protein
MKRILALKSEKAELQKKFQNQKNQNEDTSEVQLDISVNNILSYSAKTKK